MVIKYYKNPNLKYTSRKRFLNLSVGPIAEEEQRSVLLGDGATTTIKTSKDNLCDYVTIDDTRWFVIYYEYINGKQVILYLQRDVIGENGLSDCFGKIERGYTETFLRNRKELSLNQRLINRKELKSISNRYGNYYVDNHDNEMWGILYFVKPTELDPSTGEPYPDKVTINIPAFTPLALTYDFIENGTVKTVKSDRNARFTFTLCMEIQDNDTRTKVYRLYDFNIVFSSNGGNSFGYNYILKSTQTSVPTLKQYSIYCENVINSGQSSTIEKVLTTIGSTIGNALISDNNTSKSVFNYLDVSDTTSASLDYNGVTIKKDNNYYKYTVSTIQNIRNGQISQDALAINEYIKGYINNLKIYIAYASQLTLKVISGEKVSTQISNVVDTKYVYNYIILSNEESGNIVIDTSKQLVDEPYSILVFPLYNVTISGGGNYIVDKEKAFMIFNTVIQYLSGENPYLVDAQIYPYCPILTGVSSSLQGYPFFSVQSNTFTTEVDVNLYPDSDIKKEYIKRQYSIISPEQSGKFTFNFYDYKTTIEDNDGVNYAKLNIRIKTALKPFGIISSAVITPDDNSLIGITYDADLRGCQPTSNGFECSLASNAFETYRRQNSNYQQIFALQKQELQVQHQVEATNEMVSGIVNTANAAMMGAIGGAAIGDTGALSVFGTKSAGAITGAAVGAGVVGAANIYQMATNDKLRSYEEDLQQQKYDLEIATIKNLPNSINRISSFNEIILKSFCYVVETYECSEQEKLIVDSFIENYGYGIGVFDYFANYAKEGWFIRGNLIKSLLNKNLHSVAETELKGGIYIYE